MLEKVFRAKLILALKKEGVFAVPIESAVTPGFPDIVTAHHTIALIECKVVRSFNSDRLLSGLFGKNQLAFYKRWWQTQGNNLWACILSEDTCQVLALPLGPGVLTKTLKHIVGYAGTNMGNFMHAAGIIERCT